MDATPLTPILNDHGDPLLNYIRFLRPSKEDMDKIQTKLGELYDRAPLIDGITGRMMDEPAFYGFFPVATLRNQCRLRGSGAITTKDRRTGQRTNGSSQQCGYMENNALRGAGAEQFALAKFGVSADQGVILICGDCKVSIIEWDEEPICGLCQKSEGLRRVKVHKSKIPTDHAAMANGAMICTPLEDIE